MGDVLLLHDPLQLNVHHARELLISETNLDVPPVTDIPRFLTFLSGLLASRAFTQVVAKHFRPLLFDLCARFLENTEENKEDQLVALSLLIENYQELYPILDELLRRPQFKDGPLAIIFDELSLTKARLHTLLLTYYRILQANGQLPNLFNWSPSPLTRIIWDENFDTASRLLAIRCFSMHMGIVEAEREKLELKIFNELYETDCPLEFGLENGQTKFVDGWLLPLLEEERLQAERQQIADYSFQWEETSVIMPEHLSSYTTNIHGVFMLRQPVLPASSPLISTSLTVKALQQISLHLSCDLPILITSPPSSGKSLLINHLASVLQPLTKNKVIIIHLADTSLEPRSLLGSYASSTTRPGTFEWKEGVLVRAMREGKWVVFKDIDRASSEVLGVIKPLVESLHLGKWIGGRATIDVPSKGPVVAAYGFAIFATRSVVPQRNGTFAKPTFFGSHKFYEIISDAPSPEDLQCIVDAKFPALAGVAASGLIRLWDAAKTLAATSSTREIGIRDLEKLCSRTRTLLSTTRHSGMDVDVDTPTPLLACFPDISLRESIYLEARDIFFGEGATTNAAIAHLDALATIVGEHLGIDYERRQFLLFRRVPELRVERDANGRNVAVIAGRTRLPAIPSTSLEGSSANARPFALHRPAITLLSRISAALAHQEPVLLTGETGTGKTSVVTHLASLLHQNLISLNLSQQTESSDLLGGFKPVDARVPAGNLLEEWTELFGGTFSRRKNESFETEVRKSVREGKWKRLAKLWKESVRMARERIRSKESTTESREPGDDQDTPRKRRKTEHGPSSLKIGEALWISFEKKVEEFEVQHVQGKSKFAFDFIEGPLVKAIRCGYWVLLDEINLASSETLECLSSLLQSPTSSITLTEQGSLEPVPRHPNFRLFACMNPATDVGKKDLPPQIRSRFTEIDVPPPDADRDTLISIVEQYIGSHAVGDKGVILDVADFYTGAKKLSTERKIADGSNHRPHFSMRTLARALTFAIDTSPTFGLRRALWEGCLMAFTMVLDQSSAIEVTALAKKHLLAGVRNPDSLLAKVPSAPPGGGSQEDFVNISPFFLQKGPLLPNPVEDYVLTPSVRRKLTDLARIILTRRFPVLIEGPTSAGKTSAVEYLAKRTGHRFVRINNHEHTDIQEYIGSYVSDPTTGKLVFKDGLLVKALRNGDWIVLDELNLAPTDVLEALNRLLDDNRELVIPETHEIVRPHPHFMLFATQNPPGLYAGRKVLSRAFRNRFLEVHFDDVPQEELKDILHQRCRIAPSYAEKIVRVFLELQKRRQSSRVFESKHGFATLRDLFRWAGRDAVGYQQLAENGFMLIAERTRRDDDKLAVKEVIESVMKVRLDMDHLYNLQTLPTDARDFLGCDVPHFSNFIWTKAMQRLFVLLSRALRYNEPVLLVGETGSGKTSVCQVYADACKQLFRCLNCHQNTETADLIGGLRPVRNRAAITSAILNESTPLLHTLGVSPVNSLQDLNLTIKQLLKDTQLHDEHRSQLEAISKRLVQSQSIFEWQDGPLVQTMRDGGVFLVDEISLADDSVLERLNSVLEPSRSIVLAERGGDDSTSPVIVANPSFKLIATMNPGGDYGKKELSPALRNRFTEIWVPPVDDRIDLELIVNSSWTHPDLQVYTPKVLDFAEWLSAAAGDKTIIGLRDLLAWVQFTNVAYQPNESALSPSDLFHHAAHMTFLDGLSSLPQLSSHSAAQISRLIMDARSRLEELVPVKPAHETEPTVVNDTQLQLGPFALPLGAHPPQGPLFNLHAPTTLQNAMRVVRAFQVPKPILLEGSPGVGKTSLITALANMSGHELCRINLSDQTDLMDLFGSDLPVEGGGPGEFAWKDGEFLEALQQGKWVLLDEMNLAPQAVLEGLNAVLDHRGSVYIPELGRSFIKHPNFRIFAAQNPLSQGGGRKGLPKSFVNRFSRVYVEELTPDDMLLVCRHVLPSLDPDHVRHMIAFNTKLQQEVSVRRAFGSVGAPWEFNLRDIIRWGELQAQCPSSHPMDFASTIYLGRFRCNSDRLATRAILDQIFQIDSAFLDNNPRITHFSTSIQAGHSQIRRRYSPSYHRPPRVLLQQNRTWEILGDCLNQSWLAILTGPRCSGKKSIIQALAHQSGNTLRQVSISSATDTMDILGGFEQADVHGQLLSSISRVISTLELSLGQSAGLHWSPEQFVALQNLKDLIVTSSNLPSCSTPLHTLAPLLSPEIREALFANLRQSELGSTGKFEWIDGPLVTAMKEGHWLLLDGANLCNPSVLDRLNSLCEPRGHITLNERGFVGGHIPVIRPHPDFRLFMTVDNQYGELSRAMRNRGIEIFLEPSTLAVDISIMQHYHRISFSRSSFVAYLTARRGIGKADHLVPFSTGHSLSQDSNLALIQDRLAALSQDEDKLRASLFTLSLTITPNLLSLHTRYYRQRGLANRVAFLEQLPKQDELLKQIYTDVLRNQSDPTFFMSQIVDIALNHSPRSLGRLLPPFAELHPHIFELQQLRSACFAFEQLNRTTSSNPHAFSTTASRRILDEVAGLHSAVPAILRSHLTSWKGTSESWHVFNTILPVLEETRAILDRDTMDYSSLRVLSKWLSAALQANPLVLQQLAAPIETLTHLLSLREGAGLFEIWNAFLPLENPSASFPLVSQMDGVSKRPENFVELRQKILDKLTLDRLNGHPQSLIDTRHILSEIQVYHSPQDSQSSWKSWSMSMLALLAFVTHSPGSSSLSSASSRFLRIGTGNPLIPVEFMITLKKLAWAVEAGQDYTNYVIELLVDWLDRLWKYDEANGPTFLFKPVQLSTTYHLCELPDVPLLSITKHEDEIRLQAHLTLSHPAKDLPRSEHILSLLGYSLKMLLSWFSPASETHAPVPHALASSYVFALEEQIKSTSHPALSSAVHLHLLPALRSLRSAPHSTWLVAQCFISYARTILDLFAPDPPIDPAACDSFAVDSLRQQIAFVDAQLALQQQLELSASGERTNESISLLQQQRDGLQERLGHYRAQPTTRDVVALQSFWAELAQFRRQVISDSKIESLIMLLLSDDSGAHQREAVVQESVNGFMQRLDTAYVGFEDLIRPLRFGLLQLRLGLRMLSSAQQVPDSSTRDFSMAAVAFPSVHGAERVKEVEPASLSASYAIDATLTQLAAHSVSHCLSKHDTLPPPVHQLYAQISRLWSLEIRQAQLAGEESSSLYKQRTLEHHASTDVELEEQEFNDLFPTFDDVLDPESVQLSTGSVTSQKLTPIHGSRLMQIHYSLTASHSADAQDAAFKSFKATRQALLISILDQPNGLMHDIDHWSLPYRAQMHFEGLRAFTRGPDTIPNFYKDANLVQSRRAFLIVSALRDRLQALVTEWPDQLVLHHLLTCCDAVLALKAYSPIAKVLSALEQLLLKTDDWEVFSNRENTLKHHRQCMIELIVEWRRLELSCWQILLQDQAKDMEEQVSQWWFKLYDAVVQGPLNALAEMKDLDSYLDDLVPLILEFIRGSPIGQFEARLRLLRSFEVYCARFSHAVSGDQRDCLLRVGTLVGAVCTEATFFSHSVTSSLQTQRKPLEKEIADFIKLASWKDINVHALKQSAQRTHHHLYKVIRKFRDVLRQPVLPLLSATAASESETKDEPSLQATAVSISQLPIVDLTVAAPISANVSAHLADLPQTYKRYRNLASSRVAPFLDTLGGNEINDLAIGVITTVKHLSSTVVDSALGAEKRTKAIKALLVRKRKAWSDLLKELKRVGFPVNLSPQRLAEQRSPRWSRENFHLQSATSRDDGRDYLLRLYAVLPEVRGCLSQHHEDINTRDLQRGVLFLEAIISFALRSRNRLLEIDTVATRVQDLRTRLQDVSSEPESIRFNPNAPSHARRLYELHNSLASSLREIQDGLLHFTELSTNNDFVPSVSSAISVCSKATEDIQSSLGAILPKISLTRTPIILPGEARILQEAETHLKTAQDLLRAQSVEQPRVAYLLDPVADWLSSALVHLDLTIPERSASDDQKFISSCLVVIQNLLKLLPQQEKEEDGDNYIYTTMTAILDVNSALKAHTIANELENAVVTISLSACEPDQKRRYIQRIESFLDVYTVLLDRHLDVLASFSRALLKLGYVLSTVILSLAKQGFCKPPDVEEDGTGDGDVEMAEGVGLGGGSGAKNVSNEIEDEAQVEGLRGEEENDEERDKNDDDDNAIEMADDVGGEMEDVPDADGSDKEQESDDDGEGPEDRREDLDSSDPNAVDEKLWGDDSALDDSKDGDDKATEAPTEQDSRESEIAAKEGHDKPPKDTSQEQQQKDAEPKEMDSGEDKTDEGDTAEEDLPDETAPNEAGAAMDEHVPEGDTLDLPEDLNLDANAEQDEQPMEDDDVSLASDGMDEDPQDTTDPAADGDEGEEQAQDDDAHVPFAVEDTQPEGEEGEAEPEESAVAQADVSPGQGDSNVDHQAEQDNKGALGSRGGAVGSQTTGDDTEENSAEAEKREGPETSGASEKDQSSSQPQPHGEEGSGSAVGHEQSGQPQEEQTSEDAPPNPFRDMGEALKEIQRRFDDILEGSEDQPKELPGDVQEQSTQLEYARPDDQDYDMEALAPAENDPKAQLNDLQIIEATEQENNKQDAPMDVDQPQTTSEQLQQIASSILPEQKQPAGDEGEPEGAILGERRLDPADPNSLRPVKDEDPVDDQDLELELRKWQASDQPEEYTEKIWSLYSSMTQDLAYALCEQLRLILEPTLATRLKGDYRTGKRLNMKKVISYIASDFTKDKIWLRRTRPSQREYQILIALDDSKSMAESHSVHLAYQTLALVTKALDRLEAGDVAIAKFGERFDVLHSFEDGAFSDQAGAQIISAFKFNQKATNVLSLVDSSLQALERARERRAVGSSSAADLWQLEVIISDGMCQDHEKLLSVLRKAEEQRVMIVFIIIDSLHQSVSATTEKSAAENSILTMEKAEFKNVGGKMELQLKRYLDSFPFEYYVVLRSMDKLPEVLAGTLRQFFERISED